MFQVKLQGSRILCGAKIRLVMVLQLRAKSLLKRYIKAAEWILIRIKWITSHVIILASASFWHHTSGTPILAI
jgi:hypothetical protein